MILLNQESFLEKLKANAEQYFVTDFCRLISLVELMANQMIRNGLELVAVSCARNYMHKQTC